MSEVADLLMPKLGLTMTEGTVARWLAAPGQRFAAGDVIVIVETDKIANEVEAPVAGEMVALRAAEGDVVPVGVPIAQWRLEGGADAARPASEAVPPPAASQASQSSPLPGDAAAPPPLQLTNRIVATPYARRLAHEASLDLLSITGSGPRGRIRAADVLRARENQTPDQQIAPAAIATLRTAPAVASPAAFSFATVDVDVSALCALDARLMRSRDGLFERRPYLALACIKALDAEDGAPVRLGFPAGGVLAAFEGTARDTLSAIAARLAQLPSGGSGGDMAIFVVDGRTQLLVPTVPGGWRMALGAAGVRIVRGEDATHHMTLALTYDVATTDHDFAAQLLDRIAALLEEPLHLLTV